MQANIKIKRQRVKKSLAASNLRKWWDNGSLDYKDIRKELGASRGGWHQYMNNNNLPSLPMAIAIEKLTCGFVRCQDWFINE